jgi:hypothetical protein
MPGHLGAPGVDRGGREVATCTVLLQNEDAYQSRTSSAPGQVRGGPQKEAERDAGDVVCSLKVQP